jgi:glutamate racemase
MSNGSLGVFDSGFGGLNTLRHLVERLPEYDYVYLGDTARAPYGPRSPEEIYAFSTQAVDFLFDHGCELVIFACNTASSDALHIIQTEYLPKCYPGKKVLGVLIPLSEEAVATTANKKVGVLATEGTVRSGAFVREIHKLDPEVAVIQQACPLLASIIEAGAYDAPETDTALEGYLRPIMAAGVDTVVLGCTHYDILKNKIRAIVGPDIRVISEGHIVAEKLERYLERHPSIAQMLERGGKRVFYSSDPTGKFNELGSAFLGMPVNAGSVSLQGSHEKS